MALDNVHVRSTVPTVERFGFDYVGKGENW